MTGSVLIALGSAIVAAIHTLIPDHWLPYVAMSRGKGWSMGKTMRITSFGAFVHLFTTAIIGLIIGFVGEAVLGGLSNVVEFLGALLLVVFGLYFVWKGWKTYKSGEGHSHSHDHSHGHSHEHPHDDPHGHSHEHNHQDKMGKSEFTIGAILGARPCAESLPIFISAATVGLTASLVTIATWVVASYIAMLLIVWLCLKGLETSKLKVFDKIGELGAGVIITVVGIIFAVFTI